MHLKVGIPVGGGGSGHSFPGKAQKNSTIDLKLV